MADKQTQFPESSFASADDQHRRIAPDFSSIYANNVVMSISQWDVAVVFGEIAGQAPDGKSVVIQRLKVNMSKELAKVFKYLLEAHLTAYEKQFGEIQIPNMKLLLAEEVNKTLATVEDAANKPKKRKVRTA